MKLANLTVIFIIIAIPIILMVSFYLSLQIDTLNMQASYNTKLLESSKDAIEAFEMTTVELNEENSEISDVKRKNVLASINTFISSFANNLGIGGTSTEYMLAYIPAVAYTLYDGYYIYSPAETKETIKNPDKVTVFMTASLIKESKNTGKLTGPFEIDESKENKAINTDTNEIVEGKILYEPKEGATPDGTYDGFAFTLNPDGSATNIRVITTTGYESLDSRMIQIVEQSAKSLKRPPKSMVIRINGNFTLY